MIPPEIRDSLSGFFFQSDTEFLIHSSSPLSGGSINRVFRLDTSSGHYCLKYNHREAFPGMFEKERMGLDILREAGSIRVPGVIHTGLTDTYSYILLEYIRAEKTLPSFMADFGMSLARLHRHTAAEFGLDHDNYMGSMVQHNDRHRDWTEFFVTERLERQLKDARDSHYFTPVDIACFQRMYGRLDDIFPKEKPSLIHGDLWNGNYIVSETGRACLIDPAVYYGHREADIAMTTLFGGFSGDFYSAYDGEFRMEKGWRERLDIYNLYPLLIHLNLFGEGYLGSIVRIIRRF
jgi:protein-ribulosamine 3-kinase